MSGQYIQKSFYIKGLNSLWIRFESRRLDQKSVRTVWFSRIFAYRAMSRKKARIAVGSRERAKLKKWDKDDKCVASDALAQPISRRLDQNTAFMREINA